MTWSSTILICRAGSGDGAGPATTEVDQAVNDFVAPADGTYLILVGANDANVSFGPRCGYRLRVGAPARRKVPVPA